MWKYALWIFLKFSSFNVRTAVGPKSLNKNELSYETPSSYSFLFYECTSPISERQMSTADVTYEEA
jgi:hypothetical protein